MPLQCPAATGIPEPDRNLECPDPAHIDGAHRCGRQYGAHWRHECSCGFDWGSVCADQIGVTVRGIAMN
jgi:hypothetical protein